jgi:hypothetical protein
MFEIERRECGDVLPPGDGEFHGAKRSANLE